MVKYFLWKTGMIKKTFQVLFIVIIGSLIFSTSPLKADITTSVKLTLLNTLSRAESEDWSLYGLGTGRVTFRADKYKNVRAQLSMDTQIADTVNFDVSRAFVKARFSGVRVTLGKARVSWGEGFIYNAGDVIFGADVTAVDMTAEELRDEAVWLSSLYVPLGTYSFFETIVLAPELNFSKILEEPDTETPSIADTQAGGRLVGRLKGIKTEAGYLYRGNELTHNPYLSFQGHLLVDWHLSGSVSIPQNPGDDSGIGETTAVSFGLFHLHKFIDDSSLSFRLEGLFKPAASWSEDKSGSEDTEYALMLYPEISWAVSDSLVFIFRNIVSPIDLSALITAGVNWNIYEGLKILGLTAVQAGEKSDTYGWNKPGCFAVSAGFQFIY
jgi:hypothetical protein